MTLESQRGGARHFAKPYVDAGILLRVGTRQELGSI